MELALLCPFPVGVVMWSAPEPRRTVIVKATFALDRDGELRLSREQLPLEIDRPAAASSDDLALASDFAPKKERVDILLVGHARAVVPAVTIPARIDVGDVHRSFLAFSSRPALEIPLTVAHLRSDTASGVPVRVGPVSPRAPARRALAGDRVLDPAGVPRGVLGGDFDFSFFNAAPLPQQLDALPEGAEIHLTGLLESAPHRTVLVPSRRPLVYLVEPTNRRIAAIDMRCDTLFVDTDRAELSLVWRGSFEAAGVEDLVTLLVGYERTGTRWAPRELRERLALATRGSPVMREHPGATGELRTAVIPLVGAVTATQVPDDEPTQVGAARLPVLPFIAAAGGEPTQVGAARPPALRLPSITAESDDEHTAVRFDAGRSPALPFLPSSTSNAEAGQQTLIGVEWPSAVLPFIAPIAPAPEREAALTSGAPGAMRSALPFVTPAPIAPAAPEAASAEEPRPEPPAAPEPELIDESDEPDPVPPHRPPAPSPPLLAVEDYVAIVTEMATRRRKEVLLQRGISAATWKRQKRMQIEALEEEALAGKADRAAALTVALERARLAGLA